MDYLTVDQARHAPGLKLVLTAGVPGPWSEAAKHLFEVKKFPFTPVAQLLFEPNESLLDWVGVRNAPVAVYPGEKPSCDWHDILELAERLAPSPALLPADPDDRKAVLDISAAICGQDGFGWNRRLTLFAIGSSSADATDLQRSYGMDDASVTRAPGRTATILQTLAERLHRQHALGRRYLVGDTLSACDIYWACFSMMVRPVPAEWAPMPEFLRDLYGTLPPEIADAVDDVLIAHRDHVFLNHFALPLDF